MRSPVVCEDALTVNRQSLQADRPAGRERNGPVRWSLDVLLPRAPAVLGAAIGVVVVGFLLLDQVLPASWQVWQGIAASLLGVAALGVGGVVGGRVRDTVTLAREVDPHLYATFCRRVDALGSMVAEVEDDWVLANDGLSLDAIRAREAARREGNAHLGYMRRVLACGMAGRTGDLPDRAAWARGLGWIDLWNRLHAAEESLFLLVPPEVVLKMAVIDERRLADSTIDTRDELLRQLRGAVALLGGSAYLAGGSQDTAKINPVNAADVDVQARLILGGVHESINYFRDLSRKGIVRTRRQLLLAGMITGLLAFALLVLLLLGGIGERQLIAAATFGLVGALVGVLNQLRSPSARLDLEEDYGLSITRLAYMPLLSGLAAVGGVLLTALLFATLEGPVSPTTGPARPVDLPALGTIFDLAAHRFGLVVAAIFGLTPGLLIDRLLDEAKTYGENLRSTTGESEPTA